MQTVSNGDNLHGVLTNLFSGKNKENINLSAAALAQRVVKAKMIIVSDIFGEEFTVINLTPVC